MIAPSASAKGIGKTHTATVKSPGSIDPNEEMQP